MQYIGSYVRIIIFMTSVLASDFIQDRTDFLHTVQCNAIFRLQQKNSVDTTLMFQLLWNRARTYPFFSFSYLLLRGWWGWEDPKLSKGMLLNCRKLNGTVGEEGDTYCLVLVGCWRVTDLCTACFVNVNTIYNCCYYYLSIPFLFQ